MYNSARRLFVPDNVRIQPSTTFNSRLTKNMRSASPRCAMEKTATRGLPAGS